jgi:hypothetical protein
MISVSSLQQNVVKREPHRRVELIRGDDVEGGARPHLDHRAVDSDELDFVVVTGGAEPPTRTASTTAPISARIAAANRTSNAKIIRAKS